MGHVQAKARIGTVLFLCALALASLFPLLADARGDRSGRADVIERLCDRQDWLGSRLKRFIIDPEICNPPPPPAEPTLSLSATPMTITAGESTMLTWDSSDATSCTASDAWSGSKAVDGSEAVSPSASAKYTLECSGAGGSISKSVSVTVNPAPAQPTITLVKTVMNDDGGVADQTDFQARIDGTAVAWGTAITVAPGAHAVTEDVAVGYTAGSWGGDCAADGTITVALGENKTCTITNDDNEPEPVAPKLTVTKVVVNDDGGTKIVADFPLFIDGNAVVSGQQVTLAAGQHVVSETGVNGYAMTVSGDCASDGTITLAAGEVKSCTITNDDVPGTLRVVKVVTNDDGGTSGADDFSFAVNGGTAIAFESDGQNDMAVDAGTYTVTEAPAAGYVASYSDCTDVVIANGETKTCTITNDDVAPVEGGDLLITEVLYDTGTGQGSEPGNEWVEIHNGTDSAIDLSGYAIHDAAGSDALPDGTVLPAGGFLVLTATSTTATFWTFPEGTMVVSLNSSIGSNGLGNAGDRVELRNASTELVDAVSWGTDVSSFDPAVAVVIAGHSISRTGMTDTDTAADWADEDTPNPGA